MTNSRARGLPTRWWQGLAVGGALLLLVAGAYVNWRIAGSTRYGLDGDLGVYRAGALEYLRGDNPYLWMPATGQGGFIYPPFALALVLPLAWGSGLVVAALWSLATVVCVAVTIALTTLRDAAGTRRRWVPLGLMVVLVWSLPLQNTLQNGQVSMVLACLVLWDLAGPTGREGRWRGIASGFATSYKLTPLIVLPWFVLTRQWRAVRAFVLTCLVCGLLGLLLGPRLTQFFLTEVIGATGSREFVGNDGNRALRGTIAQAALSDSGEFLVWVLACAVVGLAAYWHAWRAWTRGDRLGAATILGCASLLLSPVSWTSHNLWVPLLVAVLWHTGVRGWQAAGWLLAFALMGAQQWAQLVDQTALAWSGGGLVETGVALLVCLCGVPAVETVHRSTGHERTVQPSVEESS